MKKKTALVFAVVIAFGIPSAAFAARPTAPGKAEAAQINSACSADAKKTGCSGMVAGKGLQKCMQKYQKANRSFQYSLKCDAAMKELKSEGGAGK